MRDGNAVTEAGRAQPLAREQGIKYLAATDPKRVLKQEAGVFEYPFLAGDVQIQDDVASGEKLLKQPHVRVNRRAVQARRIDS